MVSSELCLLHNTTRNQRAVQKGQAMADSYGHLHTAQHGTCQGSECGSGEVGVKNHRQFPNWFLKTTLSAVGCLCFCEQGLVQVPSLLLRLKQSPPPPPPMLHPVSPILPWSPGCGFEHSHYGNHGNKSLGCPVIYVLLPVTAAELPNCNSLPKAPHSPLPKITLLGFIGQWLLRWKGQSASSSFKEHNVAGESVLTSRAAAINKILQAKTSPFFS